MDTQGFHFANPFWLYWIPLALVGIVVAFFFSRSKIATLSLGNPRLVESVSSYFPPQLITWFLRFLVLVLCLIAAARPQAGQKKIEEKKQVTDLFVALDVSGSMVTPDLKPNRITAAKKLLSEFLDKVQNVRVGLTIFARISFTQCPLTTDLEVVKQLLANVEPAPYSIKLDGTAIGDGLVSCLNRLQNGTKKDLNSEDNSQSLASKWFRTEPAQKEDDSNNEAIILLTDGGNNAGIVDPFTAARIAASRGVKIYAIGVGGKERVPALLTYPDGKMGYGLDRNGQVIMEDPVDMVTLGEIARISGGRAYAATDNNSLQSILNDIAKLEKRDVTVTSHWEYNELASYFLLAAFILLALDIILEMTVLRTLP